MLIDFSPAGEQALEHFKDGAGITHAIMHVDDNGRVMHGRLTPGCSIGMHTHTGSYEVVYVISGTGTALYDDTQEPLAPGTCHYCPPDHAHSLVNTGTEDLVFFAVVPNC